MDIREILYGDRDIYSTVEPCSNFHTKWGSNDLIFKKLISQTLPSMIFEIGSWEGLSAIHMANICKELKLDCHILCIDTFTGCPEHWTHPRFKNIMDIGPDGRPRLYERFLGNILGAGHQDMITPFPVPSTNAWKALKVFKVYADLVYVDGDHGSDTVRDDVEGFWPLTRRIMFGHDAHFKGVKTVTEEKGITEGFHDFWIWRK